MLKVAGLTSCESNSIEGKEEIHCYSLSGIELVQLIKYDLSRGLRRGV